jgi:hypothetical protein
MYRRGPRPSRRGRRHRPARSVAGQLKPGDIVVEFDGLSPAQVTYYGCLNSGLSAAESLIADTPRTDRDELDRPETITKVILAVAHRRYRQGGWPMMMRLLKSGRDLVADVPACPGRDDVP